MHNTNGARGVSQKSLRVIQVPTSPQMVNQSIYRAIQISVPISFHYFVSS